jgi:hypothetical protein
MTLSASILFLLGLGHLLLTFRGPKLLPRDHALIETMAKVAPVITTQTSIWKMWMGFNASHSMGAVFFGLVYGYLALAQGELLFGSVFLQALGFAVLVGFVVLAKVYWFITPLVGSCISLALYTLSVIMARVG